MSAPSVFSARVSVALHILSRVRSSHEGRAGFGIGGKAEAERECLATKIGRIAASATQNRYQTKRQGRHRRTFLYLSVLEIRNSVPRFST